MWKSAKAWKTGQKFRLIGFASREGAGIRQFLDKKLAFLDIYTIDCYNHSTKREGECL